MKIGLDFDNTLADYDRAFQEAAAESRLIEKNWSGNKRQLKTYILDLPNGEKHWQELQGLVYGLWMHQAVMMDGAAWFLHRCRVQGIPIVIVSHKTEYSLKDPNKVPLRKMALDWMTAQGFFDPKVFNIRRENVYFENTLANNSYGIIFQIEKKIFVCSTSSSIRIVFRKSYLLRF